MKFKSFDKQSPVLESTKKVIGAFAGKRGGKTEVGAIKSIMWQEQKPGYTPNGIDPYLGIIAAPTNDMLTRLSWKKFMAYAKPFIRSSLKTPFKLINWHDSVEGNESIIYGISADRPERIEGIKANWIWIDEVFQVSEQFFLECLARVSDSNGYILCTGSLGVQIINPKNHWCYKYFKEQIDSETECFEWGTEDNPYYPREQIVRYKRILDPRTYRAMFQIEWDIVPLTAVYEEFTDDNVIKGLTHNKNLPTFACVDWGWSHPMAVGIFQYDKRKDQVYLIEEVVKSKMRLDDLYTWLKGRAYPIHHYICDIAGDQEREQTGRSNIAWFKSKGIYFKRRRSRINQGVAIVRSYINNCHGKRRFFVSDKCQDTIDGLRKYKYPEKDGIVQNENPVKKDDDAVDMVRYYFINQHDPARETDSYITIE